MSKDKRYVVTMDVYVYAKDDYSARYKAHKQAKKIGADVTEIGEQPFASFNYRKLEDHSEPISKSEKEKPLPF
jgi:hypothetical protein